MAGVDAADWEGGGRWAAERLRPWGDRRLSLERALCGYPSSQGGGGALQLPSPPHPPMDMLGGVGEERGRLLQLGSISPSAQLSGPWAPRSGSVLAATALMRTWIQGRRAPSPAVRRSHPARSHGREAARTLAKG